MPDLIEQSAEVQQTQAQETTAVETAAVETPQEGAVETQEVKPTETTETEEQPAGTTEVQQTEQLVPEKRKYTLKIDGQEVEQEYSDDEVVQELQKATHFTRKQQALSEVEKANQWKLQTFDQIAANPNLMKMVFAASQGLDPSVVTANPQPPPEQLRDIAPELYYDQLAQYKVQTQTKEMVDRATEQYVLNTVHHNNNAVFEKARITHELGDAEASQVMSFVQTRLRPNALGMYSEQDLDYAVNALFGRQRTEREVLKTAENINKTIQKGAKQVPRKATTVKTEELPPDVEDARQYKDFVKELAGAR